MNTLQTYAIYPHTSSAHGYWLRTCESMVEIIKCDAIYSLNLFYSIKQD